MKFGAWLNEWLSYCVKPSVKEQTYLKYERHVRVHIQAALGCYELEDLNGALLQQFAASLTEDGLSTNTVTGILTVLKLSLKRAVELSVCDVEHSSSIKLPRRKERCVECFSRTEQKALEEYIMSSKKPVLFGITLALYTGLRIGELLALEWSDINFEDGIISVTKSCRDGWGSGGYEKIIETPKTESSTRVIPLPEQLIPQLIFLRSSSSHTYVIGNKAEGVPIRSYQRTFALIQRQIGIPHRGFHALRHTFATRALECGVDVRTLSELLGHKNPSITLSRYAHSMTEHKKSMMNKLGELLII